MDESFLHELRGDPPPEFRRALRERLRKQEQSRRTWGLRPVPALAIGCAALVSVALFTLPSVRASAKDLLDLFRVRTFAAVQFEESRIEKLRSLKQDNTFLVFDRKEQMLDPGQPQYYPSLAAAGAAAGLQVRTPSYLPNGLALDSIFVQGPGQARISVSEAKLRALLDQLDLRDVSVPEGIDGKWIEVRKPSIVIQRFRAARREAGLVQAMSPEVSVPAGVDVVRLAEMGLRVLGLDAGEARRIAQSTDWRTTVLVPVPMNASTFRQVTIRGQKGLLITTSTRSSNNGNRQREGSIVMWTEGDRVFGLMTNVPSSDAVQMAESVQ